MTKLVIQNQIKFSLYSLSTFEGVVSWRSLSLQSCAKGTQCNVAAVAGRWQPVLDLIDPEIEPDLPHKLWYSSQTHLLLGQLVG